MKRYDAVNTNGDPLYAPSSDGEMVFYSDVAAMVVMNAELVHMLKQAHCLVNPDINPTAKASMLHGTALLLAKAKELSQ